MNSFSGFHTIRGKLRQLGPGSRMFLKSLSWVSLYFAISKFFSSITTVIVARYLGAINFGDAQLVLLLAQMLSLAMLFGMHVVAIRYSAGKRDPAPVIGSSVYMALITTVITGIFVWVNRDTLIQWLDFDEHKIAWVIGLGTLFCAYLMFTSIYQALQYFQQRGQIEVFFAFLLLPGLAIGHLLTGGEYETLLIAYAIAYSVSLVPMIWRFRLYLKPQIPMKSELREMISYGGLSCICTFGYVLTFILQPIQLQYYQNTEQVGIFRLYCYGSINMAAFATSIISTVLFPKMSASSDRLGVWRKLDKIWIRISGPMLLAFAVVGAVTVALAGDEFPLVWSHVILFAIASSLITVQSTYGQILAAQGVRGMRWGLLLSVLSGLINFGLSAILIPRLAIMGAILALIINYGITLIGTFLVRDIVLKKLPSAIV